jgi:hypothetical protein
MVVVAEIAVPAESFELGTIFSELPDLSIEAESVVPHRHADLSLFWITKVESIDIEEFAEASPLVESVTPLITTGSKTLYRLRWTQPVDGIIDTIASVDGDLIDAESPSGEGQWRFKIRFRDRNDVPDFTRLMTERGVPITLSRLYDPENDVDSTPLSTEQRNTLVAAYERGYFDVPRRVSLAELGDEFGISDNAVSQRLRRGISTLIYEHLILRKDEHR